MKALLYINNTERQIIKKIPYNTFVISLQPSCKISLKFLLIFAKYVELE